MSKLVAKIAEEASRRDGISFARFMELALYCPEYGYYEKEEDNIGREGDYYTNVSVGPLFGRLLAFQFSEWLRKIEHRDPKANVPGTGTAVSILDPVSTVSIAEAGAHNGRLARDILEWLGQHDPELLSRLRYWIIEPSPRRRLWQERSLAFLKHKVVWVSDLRELTIACGGQFTGIIFGNELLDAMPVQRFGWDALRKVWFEWLVAFYRGRFAWNRSQLASEMAIEHLLLARIPSSLLAVLPDGFTLEHSSAAVAWWSEAARFLTRGKLLVLDYGLALEDFLEPHRAGGTLRAYRAHRFCEDILADPGEQDLTAHVNFTLIREAGEAAGLKTEELLEQARFFIPIAERIWSRQTSFGNWGELETRQFRTLINPETLGRAFKVLIQSKGSG